MSPTMWSCFLLSSVIAAAAGPSLQGREGEIGTCSDGEEDTVAASAARGAFSLIQKKRSTRETRAAFTESRTRREQSASARNVLGLAQLAWFHIPKTGTSFANTLFHFANASLPASAQLPIQESSSDRYDLIPQFLEEYPLGPWFDGCFWMGRLDLPGQHDGILQRDYDAWAGDFVGFFREPAARARSSFQYFKTRCEANGGSGSECSMTPAAYAKRVDGLVTKMLTGQLENGLDCSTVTNSCQGESEVPDLSLASLRLDGFKFIGLTEHWSLSICLFHTMFGGSCLESEFANTRPAEDSDAQTSTSDDDDAFWETHIDPADSAVYAIASRVFWENVVKYNVTLESCTSICPSLPEQ